MTTFKLLLAGALAAATLSAGGDLSAADTSKLAVRSAIHKAGSQHAQLPHATAATSTVKPVSWPYPYYAGWRGGYYRPYGYGYAYTAYRPYYGYTYAYRPWGYYGHWGSYYYPRYYGYSAYTSYYGYSGPYGGFYGGYYPARPVYVGSGFYPPVYGW